MRMATPSRRNIYLAVILVAILCFVFLPRYSQLTTAPPSSFEKKPTRNFIAPQSRVSPIKQTGLLLRPDGFTVSDNLYLRNGTLYAVVDDPSSWPDLKFVLAKGIPTDLGLDTSPTDKVSRTHRLESRLVYRGGQEMQVITPREADSILGETSLVIDGMTLILYDSAQFMVVSNL